MFLLSMSNSETADQQSFADKTVAKLTTKKTTPKPQISSQCREEGKD